jgi:hypothetical protein
MKGIKGFLLLKILQSFKIVTFKKGINIMKKNKMLEKNIKFLSNFNNKKIGLIIMQIKI